jgi:hypothetical protein
MKLRRVEVFEPDLDPAARACACLNTEAVAIADVDHRPVEGFSGR